MHGSLPRSRRLKQNKKGELENEVRASTKREQKMESTGKRQTKEERGLFYELGVPTRARARELGP